jgi:hypothetical protein
MGTYGPWLPYEDKKTQQAYADGCIGYIKSRKVPPKGLQVYKVYHIAPSKAIDGIAQGTAQQGAQSQLAVHTALGPAAVRHVEG